MAFIPSSCNSDTSLAFFLLASVPPSLPRKESSFFLDGGDFGVGDLGEEGDFWGDDAMAARPALGDGGDGCEAPEPWEAAPGSERKRNYSRHLKLAPQTTAGC